MADETKLTAATRLEKLLDNIAGGDNEVTPATRLEKFLSYIADAMEGGGGSGGVQLYGPYVAHLYSTSNIAPGTDGPLLIETITDPQKVYYYDKESLQTPVIFSGLLNNSSTKGDVISLTMYYGDIAASFKNTTENTISLENGEVDVIFYSLHELAEAALP